jgi:hypothetical protein
MKLVALYKQNKRGLKICDLGSFISLNARVFSPGFNHVIRLPNLQHGAHGTSVPQLMVL